jgi:hypothetical protein
MVTKPEFLEIGNIVKVQHWYGEIVDVAVSDQRIMVLVASPKGIWRNHPAEWLEFDPRQITPASIDDAIDQFDIYIERVEKMLDELHTMKQAWQMRATPMAMPALTR